MHFFLGNVLNEGMDIYLIEWTKADMNEVTWKM